jgi:hypothetical protein
MAKSLTPISGQLSLSPGIRDRLRPLKLTYHWWIGSKTFSNETI